MLFVALCYLIAHPFLPRDEKHHLFRAVDNVPCIARKAEWAKRWITDPTRCFAERLVAFACVEGIHFSGSFCAIYWLKQRGPIMPGLTFSNELISRDEGLHTDFACALYGHLRHRLPAMVVYEIVSEAVALEEEFCTQALRYVVNIWSTSGQRVVNVWSTCGQRPLCRVVCLCDNCVIIIVSVHKHE